jgi:hypothetical protein
LMRVLPFKKPVSKPACLTLLALSLAFIGNANAGVTIKGPGDSSLSLGVGLRMSYTGRDEADQDFELENTRIFTSGQITKNISAVFNLEKKGGPDDEEELATMDAIGQFAFSPELNLWVGRMLPAVDRANLAGPFYATGWSYPGLVSGNPAIAVGRDNGAQVWGNIASFKYAVGLFEGHNNFDGPGGTDSLALTGRLAYYMIGSEAGPVYYENATYHGAQDLLTFAFGFQSQNDGVGTAAEQDDYLSWNIDVLYESKLTPSSGSLTLEGAYYKYDYDVLDTAPRGDRDNIGGAPAPGDAYLASIAYLFSSLVGPGRLQPYVRYQFKENDIADIDADQWDFGVNYVIKSHDARISLTYTDFDSDDDTLDDKYFVLGVQLQY